LIDEAYGNEFRLAHAYVQKLSTWPAIKANDAAGLKSLSCFMIRTVNAMKGLKYAEKLNHPDALRDIAGKLPMYLQNRWSEKGHKLAKKNGAVGMNDLCAFIKENSDVANCPMFGKKPVAQNENPRNQGAASSKEIEQARCVQNFSTDASALSQNVSACQFCQKVGHGIERCSELSDLTLSEKKTKLKQKGLCFGCLTRGHVVKFCKRRWKCSVCERRHPTFLHDDTYHASNAKGGHASVEPYDNTIDNGAVLLPSKMHVFHPLLPVKVHLKGSRHTVLTYCFLNNGSSGCFMTDGLRQRLGTDGVASWLKINTINGASYESCSAVSDLVVTDIDGHHPVCLPKVFTRQVIPMDHNHLAHRDMDMDELNEFHHLLPSYLPDVQVGLLLGCNTPLLEPLELYPSQSHTSIYGVRYLHGWTVQGTDGGQDFVEEQRCNRTAIKEVLSAPSIMNLLESDFNDVRACAEPDERG
jgi:hypothetical protein